MDIKRPPAHQPIPPDAKQVFKGVLYDAYHWQQKRFDGSMTTYERLRRNDSVVIVPVTERGTILTMREQQPGTDWYLNVPCGGVEDGEAPEVAAARELLEETGYEAGALEFWYAHQVEHRVDWAIYYFIARNCRKIGAPDAGAGEQTQLREVSFDEFLRLTTADDFQNISLCQPLLKALLDPKEMVALKKRFGVQ